MSGRLTSSQCLDCVCRADLRGRPHGVARPAGARGAAVAIDPDDIGGVVTGPKGPEAGVWVIAETRDIQFATSRASSPTTAAATSSLTCRRRTTRCGRAATDLSTATSPPPRPANAESPPSRRPTPAAAAHYYPAIYWYSMLKIPTAGRLRRQQRYSCCRPSRQWSAGENTGCVGCHQLGQASTRTIPPALGTFGTGATRGPAVCSRASRGRR